MVSNVRFSVPGGTFGSPLVRFRQGHEESGSWRFFATREISACSSAGFVVKVPRQAAGISLKGRVVIAARGCATRWATMAYQHPYVKQVNRCATVAFAPTSPYIATGTMAGAIDLSFSTTACLEVRTPRVIHPKVDNS